MESSATVKAEQDISIVQKAYADFAADIMNKRAPEDPVFS